MHGYSANLRGRNLAHAHRRVAHAYAEAAAQHSPVVGVLLLGGAARGFGDENSDIDIVVFVDRQGFHAIRRGEQVWKGYHLDVGVVYYECALQEEWTMVQRWTYAEAQILYDPSGKIRRLLRHKVRFPEAERKLILVDSIMRLGWYGLNYRTGVWRGYHFFKKPDFWLRRGDVTSAHHILSIAEDILLDILFAYNHALIPDEKWKVHVAYSLKWLPSGFYRHFEQVMLIRELTESEFERRLDSFMIIFRATMRRLERSRLLPRNIYRYLLKYSSYYRENSV